MYDKDLIERVCNLTCTKEDVVRNQNTIKYDTEYPFNKYYDINAIIGAFNKYLSKEWDDLTLSGWFCIYDWIIRGGFFNIVEDLNPLEQFLVDVISWDLDGLSFFDEEYLENGLDEVYESMEQLKNLDHVWQTRFEWKGVYSPIGECDKGNGEQYVVLINDKTKEYMIMYSDYFKNGYEDEFFKYVSEEEFKKLIEELKTKDYTIISFAEELYYSEIEE